VDIWWLGGSFVHEVGVGAMVFSFVGCGALRFFAGMVGGGEEWSCSMGPNRAQGSMAIMKGVRTMFFLHSFLMTSSPCGRGGEFAHTSKVTLFVMQKVVICIGSDCGENVFSSGRVDRSWGYVWAQ